MSHLTWGGVDCVDLAGRFGTPLYVIDETVVRARCAEIRRDFLERWPGARASYAAKAFLTRAMARIVEQEGLGLDVVSLGELHMALSAGFPPERIEMNGNAKSAEELAAALDAGVGRVIVDSLMELDVLADMAEAKGKRAPVLLRVAPGVDAHTHAFIATGQTGSKFGLPIDGPLLSRAVRTTMERKGLQLLGLHFHVGSQLFDPDTHVRAAARVLEAAARLRDTLGFEMQELNFGGGLGARLNPSQPHVPLALFTDAVMEALKQGCASHGLPCPRPAIEPGRWVISEAGITLYRVETVKELEGITYVAVDGGMADNPRHPLYDALYDAVDVERANAPADDWGGGRVSIVGKCCESGDVLIDDARLPRVGRGSLLALYNSGAYTFSMASNYNLLGRPAVVLAGEGRAELIAARQTPDDLLRGDVIPERLSAD
ncbi:MAG: diaminopimelate decarboxylase [Fretibacterium sp.]|nr:diaminopimelate decarboxylase [Fretibacterium sp.]